MYWTTNTEGNMKTKYKTKNNSLLSAFLTGNCIGLFIFGVLASAFALILTKKDISNETVRYFLLFSAFFAAFSSSFYPAKKTKMKGFLVGLINGMIISIILILLLLIINKLNVTFHTFLIIPLAISGGTAGGIIASNMK